MTSKSCSLTRCLNNRRILIIYKKKACRLTYFLQWGSYWDPS